MEKKTNRAQSRTILDRFQFHGRPLLLDIGLLRRCRRSILGRLVRRRPIVRTTRKYESSRRDDDDLQPVREGQRPEGGKLHGRENPSGSLEVETQSNPSEAGRTRNRSMPPTSSISPQMRVHLQFVIGCSASGIPKNKSARFHSQGMSGMANLGQTSNTSTQP